MKGAGVETGEGGRSSCPAFLFGRIQKTAEYVLTSLLQLLLSCLVMFPHSLTLFKLPHCESEEFFFHLHCSPGPSVDSFQVLFILLFSCPLESTLKEPIIPKQVIREGRQFVLVVTPLLALQKMEVR